MAWGSPSDFARTFGTRAEEIESVRPNPFRDDLLDACIDVLKSWNFQILHSPAHFAHEMVVFPEKCIVPLDPLAEVQFLNLSLFLQDVEITVHSTERDLRHLLADLVKYPFSRRM